MIHGLPQDERAVSTTRTPTPTPGVRGQNRSAVFRRLSGTAFSVGSADDSGCYGIRTRRRRDSWLTWGFSPAISRRRSMLSDSRYITPGRYGRGGEIRTPGLLLPNPKNGGIGMCQSVSFCVGTYRSNRGDGRTSRHRPDRLIQPGAPRIDTSLIHRNRRRPSDTSRWDTLDRQRTA
jgi:hypothetical protein